MFKKNKYIGYIYKIICIVNNKIYIGQTRWNINDRWSGHKHDAFRKNNMTVFGKAIRKYGPENFKVEMVEEIVADTKDELNRLLNEKEQYYIKYYHSLSHENGYNTTPGGNSVGEAQKTKTYCFNKDGTFIGEFNSRADAGRFIGVSGERVSGAIMRNGLVNGYYFSNTKEFKYAVPFKYINVKVYKYDLCGNLISIYNNYIDASIKNGVNAANIYHVCLGKGYSLKNYVYRFEGDGFDKYKPTIMTRKVNLYNKDNKFIDTFNSIKECAEYLSANPSNVSAVLNPNINSNTVRDHKVFYSYDPNQPDPSKVLAYT